jgi:pimeloyl-ACP methyl ester carboxylesterase
MVSASVLAPSRGVKVCYAPAVPSFRRTLLALGLLAAALGALLVVRAVARSRLEKGLIVTRAQGSKTPAQFGAPYEEVLIASEERTLKAFWVSPPAPANGKAPISFVIFHGRQESISSWSAVQAFLWQRGAGSMVFDYAGFGGSTGAPSAEHLRADGKAAWAAFRRKLPPGAIACAYGLSLGSGVLLEVAAELEPRPDCLVVYGAFTSALGAAAALHAVPDWLVPLLPDAFESERNAARAPAPLLVQHGDRDELIPVWMAERVAKAAPGARLLVMPGYSHAQPLVAPDDAAWAPVLAHARGEVYPR